MISRALGNRAANLDADTKAYFARITSRALEKILDLDLTPSWPRLASLPSFERSIPLPLPAATARFDRRELAVLTKFLPLPTASYFATARSINGAGNATSPTLGSRATRLSHTSS